MARQNLHAGTATAGAEVSFQAHWDDLQGSVAEGSGGAALTFAAFRDTPFKFASFRDAQNDELHMTYQMPHSWEPGTEVRPHIHVIPLAAANGTVVLEGQYVWVPSFGEAAANAGWTTFRVEHDILAAEANVLDIISLFQSTAPATVSESGILLVYVKRSGGDGADDYAGDLAVVSIDCHFQRAKMGTIPEFPES